MNLFRQSIYFCASLFAGAILLSSCELDSDETLNNLYYAYSFANVIEGENVYTLQLDNGYWMEISKNSIDMSGSKRAYVECSFYENKLVTSGSKTYIDPYNYSLYKVSVEEPYNELEAAENHITDTDSIFSLNSFQCTVYKGYLSAVISTPYVYSIQPSAHLYFSTPEITADTAAVHLVVNRHSLTSTAGNCNLLYSFAMDKVAALCQSTDSITLAIYSSVSSDPVCAKVAVSDLKLPIEEEKE